MATIPGFGEMLVFVLATFLTLGILGFLWHAYNRRARSVETEIRLLFRRELGIETS